LGINEYNCEKNWKENSTCMRKVLRQNREEVIELNACDTTDDFKFKKRKDDLVVHEEGSGEKGSDCAMCNERDWKVLQNLLPLAANEMACTKSQNRVLFKYHHIWLNWIYTGGCLMTTVLICSVKYYTRQRSIIQIRKNCNTNNSSLHLNEEESCENEKEEIIRIYRWEYKLGEEVLLDCHSTSDAVLGITVEFMRNFDDPCVITIIIEPLCYEISDKERKIRVTFNKTALGKYLRESGGD
jgi:hypothetical protein